MATRAKIFLNSDCFTLIKLTITFNYCKQIAADVSAVFNLPGPEKLRKGTGADEVEFDFKKKGGYISNFFLLPDSK